MMTEGLTDNKFEIPYRTIVEKYEIVLEGGIYYCVYKKLMLKNEMMFI